MKDFNKAVIGSNRKKSNL